MTSLKLITGPEVGRRDPELSLYLWVVMRTVFRDFWPYACHALRPTAHDEPPISVADYVALTICIWFFKLNASEPRYLGLSSRRTKDKLGLAQPLGR
jgi:hypothetical protein